MVYLSNLVFAHPGNVTTFMQQLQYINGLTDVGMGGMLGIGLLILIGGMLMLMMKNFGNERAFSVTGIIVGFLAIFLRILSLINDNTLTICVILGVTGILLLVKDAGQYE